MAKDVFAEIVDAFWFIDSLVAGGACVRKDVIDMINLLHCGYVYASISGYKRQAPGT